MFNFKNYVVSFVSLIITFFIHILGGWDTGLATLIYFMCIDYITGFLVAAVFKKSQKSYLGGLESSVGLKGLSKKCMMLSFVLIAYRLDLIIGSSFVRNAVIIGFVINEAVSITENAGLMGIPIPDVIIKAIDILKKKESED